MVGFTTPDPCALDLREMEAGAILKGEPYRPHAVVVDQFKQRLPICHQRSKGRAALTNLLETGFCILDLRTRVLRGQRVGTIGLNPHLQERSELRSEEHTSELQSRFDLVCR